MGAEGVDAEGAGGRKAAHRKRFASLADGVAGDHIESPAADAADLEVSGGACVGPTGGAAKGEDVMGVAGQVERLVERKRSNRAQCRAPGSAESAVQALAGRCGSGEAVFRRDREGRRAIPGVGRTEGQARKARGSELPRRIDAGEK